MKRCRLVSVVKLTTFLAPYEHVLIKCSGFSWERILFLKSACVIVVKQMQVGDTRFFVNPPGSVENLKIAFCVRFRTHVLWILVYFTKTIRENMKC